MTGEARTSNTSEQPLDGLTVLDLSRVLVGPFCTMQLGDLGAEVIKIERPDGGDQTRKWYPPSYGDESAYYVSINRNKRSLTLNLASEEGREVLRDLASQVDVLVENFRVGKMADWGLDYEDLYDENPELIYCSLSGYGEWGPDKDRPAYDIMMQAEGGLMSITGEKNGPPVRVGVAIADIGAGMYATQAILAALLYRELGDGTGQKIDVSLLDGQVAWTTYMASYYFATGDPPGRMGSKHPTIAPYQAFETSDGYVVIAVGSENLWTKFCRALDLENIADDKRFTVNSDRVANRAELDRILNEEFEQYSTAEVVARMEEAGVPVSPVQDMADIFDNPQVQARGMHREIEHPTIGTVEMAGSPMNFSRTSTAIDRHPPLLGEHTAEVLCEFGYDKQTIDNLDDQDVI